MSKVLIEEQTLYDIADAVRDRTGLTATYKPAEIANAILGIRVNGVPTLGGTTDPIDSLGQNGSMYIKYSDTSIYRCLSYLGVGDNPGPYINISVVPSSITKFDIRYRYTDSRANQNGNAVFGCSASGKESQIQSHNGLMHITWGNSVLTSQFDTNWHTVSFENGVITYDSDSSVNQGFSFAGLPVCLFGASYGNVIASKKAFNAEIASCNVETETQSYHFIPVKRMSDNQLGMYDTGHSVFYTNDGYGTFVAGDETSDLGDIKPIVNVFVKVDGTWIPLSEAKYTDLNIENESSS